MTGRARAAVLTVLGLALAATVALLGATGAAAVFVLLPTVCVAGLVDFFYDSRRATFGAAIATFAVMLALAAVVVASTRPAGSGGTAGGPAPAGMR